MFTRICKTSEIQNGELYRFDVGGKPLLVTRVSETFFVTDSICTHEESDLSLGIFQGMVLTCPLHQAKFNIDSGKVVSGPDGDSPDSIRSLGVYQTRIEGEDLMADI